MYIVEGECVGKKIHDSSRNCTHKIANREREKSSAKNEKNRKKEE